MGRSIGPVPNFKCHEDRTSRWSVLAQYLCPGQYVIRPKRNGEFVAAMENVIETYELPHDPEVPVVTMDEQPVQLFKETRTPIPATRHHPEASLC